MQKLSFNKIFFVLLFTLSTTLASFFLSWRFSVLFNFKLFAFTFIFLGFFIAFLLLSFYEWHHKSFLLTRTLLKPLSVFLGVALFAFSLSIIETILYYTTTLQSWLPSLYIISLSLLIFYSFIAAAYPKTKRITLQIKNLKEPLTLAHISDLHLGAIRGNFFLKRVVKKLNKLNPNVVAITGDTFDGSGNPSKEMIAPLKNLKPKTFAVLGNHDAYIDPDLAESLLKTYTTLLRGTTTKVKGVQFAGLDCPDHANWKQPEPNILKLKVKKDEPLILLYHTPNGFKEAQEINTDLILCGHTHQGQLFPMYLFIKLFFKYTYGLFKLNSMFLYVSRGIGTWGPPMRLGARAEIVLFTLKP